MCGQHLIHKVFIWATKVFLLVTKGFPGLFSSVAKTLLLITKIFFLIARVLESYRSTMKALFYAAELACYSGAILSLVIAIKLLRMENLTFFNSMFLVYFSLDFIFGNIETYFHFKLWKDR